ncbi:glycoside hydrolase family protein [Desulfobacula sp.]|uniref:glycoside hydrolase family protein n=1 Tax=Desulfobacula sp. TaxID=2593537 RepID=UPI0039B8C9E6
MKKIADQLIKHEGLRLKPYHCPAGKLTIGVGRNLEDKGNPNLSSLNKLLNSLGLTLTIRSKENAA